MGYASGEGQTLVNAGDCWYDRVLRFMRDPHFVELRQSVPTCLTMDDQDYGFYNNADRTTFAPWSVAAFNRVHAERSNAGYVDWRYGDVHCMTLDGRRYSDPLGTPESPAKTKIGVAQKARLRTILTTSTANMFVVFSASSFALRGYYGDVADTYITGWRTECLDLLRWFHYLQLRGKRVVILSGDAHGQRIHYHPDPVRRAGTAGHPVIEFICAGLRARSWSWSKYNDPTRDLRRQVFEKSGLGLIEIDPPGTPSRAVTLRSIHGDAGPLDLFPPLVVPFAP